MKTLFCSGCDKEGDVRSLRVTCPECSEMYWMEEDKNLMDDEVTIDDGMQIHEECGSEVVAECYGCCSGGW